MCVCECVHAVRLKPVNEAALLNISVGYWKKFDTVGNRQQVHND